MIKFNKMLLVAVVASISFQSNAMRPEHNTKVQFVNHSPYLVFIFPLENDRPRYIEVDPGKESAQLNFEEGLFLGCANGTYKLMVDPSMSAATLYDLYELNPGMGMRELVDVRSRDVVVTINHDMSVHLMDRAGKAKPRVQKVHRPSFQIHGQ